MALRDCRLVGGDKAGRMEVIMKIIDEDRTYDIDAYKHTWEAEYGSPMRVEIAGFVRDWKYGPTPKKPKGPQIKDVIFHDPATIVYWTDGTKTVVKCQPGDEYDPLEGFLLAVFKKACGNKSNYNNALRKIVPGYGKE